MRPPKKIPGRWPGIFPVTVQAIPVFTMAAVDQPSGRSVCCMAPATHNT
jgi:hypothetical protein